jgi:hypothetical protein
MEAYPRRFENAKSGKAGYSPVCGNEWVRGVCEKPRIKCSDCQFQGWLPVTDEVLRMYPSGVDERGRNFVAGVYPMLLDERCHFLAVDLLCAESKLVIEIEGHQHLNDAAAYRRDRRKDALLQANGYFILRFLADDLGKHLEMVLDTVLWTMAGRT